MPTPLLNGAFTALLLVVCLPITVRAQTALKNGDVFQNVKYSSDTTYDANAKLKDETAYSSMILWKSCTLSSKVTVSGTFDTKKDFPTSLYFMVEKATFSGAGQFDFFDLPPNSYVHAVGTKANGATKTIYNIRPTTMTNNITAFIDDSTVSVDSGSTYFVILEVPVGSPYIVTHMRNAKLTNTYAIFQTTTCSDGSTIFLEKVTCTKCRMDLVSLQQVTSIARQSALILKEITIVNHATPTRDGLIVTGDAVVVDATSVLAMVDIDLTDNFKAGTPLRLFYRTQLSGAGAIVFLRIKMGSSGLGDIQPANNANFWVVAMQISSREMTSAELIAVNFNVNTKNVIRWDGTGANNQCVQAGLALPGTATYKMVNGKCEATCPQGNYLQPACTPRAVCTGVPNCEACYAHPKDKCLECLPHTTAINGDTGCKCPIRECVTCPTATLCSECSKDHIFSAEHNSCFHCKMSKCTGCKADGQCATCEDGYKVYNNQCTPCTIDKCNSCSGPSKCVECIADHKPTADGKKCIHCPVSGCKECSAEGVCGSCEEGYIFVPSSTSTNNKCIRCSADVPKCKSCKTDGVCHECIADHKPANEGKVCFQCAIPFCTECSADGVCGVCEDGYWLEENRCVRCSIDVEKCKSCKTDGVCHICVDDHKPANEGKDCFHCTIPSCKACSAAGVCADCEEGHSLVDNKCVHCSVDIDKCHHCKTEGVCSECIADHKPANEGKACFHCTIPFCTECSADGVCRSCQDGYSLVISENPTDNKCLRCSIDVPNCHTCKTDGICSECITDHKVSPDGLRCTLCKVDGCQRCDLPSTCALCKTGMTANDDGQCTPCDIGNCTHCSENNKCAMCACGMVPSDDDKTCVLCATANCRECDPSGGGVKCAECQDGYELSSDGACAKIRLPNWALFLMVMAASIVIVVAVIAAYLLYMRRVARLAEMAADAEERRKNRQAVGRGGRHHMDIAILDLADLEGAASGVRDTVK